MISPESPFILVLRLEREIDKLLGKATRAKFVSNKILEDRGSSRDGSKWFKTGRAMLLMNSLNHVRNTYVTGSFVEGLYLL